MTLDGIVLVLIWWVAIVTIAVVWSRVPKP